MRVDFNGTRLPAWGLIPLTFKPIPVTVPGISYSVVKKSHQMERRKLFKDQEAAGKIVDTWTKMRY